jgi:uncharacterized membrane protein YadS
MASAETTRRAPWGRAGFLSSEDWLAIWLGAWILLVALAIPYLSRPDDFSSRALEVQTLSEQVRSLQDAEQLAHDPAAEEELLERSNLNQRRLEKLQKSLIGELTPSWLAKPGEWARNPLDSFYKDDHLIVGGLLAALIVCGLLFATGIKLTGESIAQFIPAFVALFLLAALAYVLAGQSVIKHYNLEYVLWALVIGLTISNTVGAPDFLLPALRTEFYIKTGLVLLGADILLSRLLLLGLPGICMSWITTPIVLVATYWFGQRILGMQSRSLNMVISADMSVCGVSAAIATAAACRAKKEELSLAVGISLAFTAVMMVVMPALIRYFNMSDVVAGAWLGGTIDSTGAVAAAGTMVSKPAGDVAMTVKMIQNILIGVVSFGVAVYWVTVVENDPQEADGAPIARPSLMEIWYRFPKFVLGFIAASLVFSAIYASGAGGKVLVEAATKGTSEQVRGWLFCLAFVSIGLETNFRELFGYLKDGKAIALYVVGQSLNLAMALFMAWLMFEKVFPQAAAILAK